MHILKKAKLTVVENIPWLLIVVTTLIAAAATIYFFLNGQQNLGNYDAIARLNIARKIIDSVTPGVGQLGGIWLPFPQMFMLPFVSNDYLWHSGLAGAIVSGISFIVAAVFLYDIIFMLTKNVRASLLGWFMFVANINILLLQSMALSEMFFLCSLILIIYFLTKWVLHHKLNDLLLTGIFCILISLTRYEGYFVMVGAAIMVAIESWRAYRKESWQKVEGMTLLFLTIAGFGVVGWCVYCFLFYGDFFYWLHLYSEGKMQVSTATQSVRDTNTAAFSVTQNTIGQAFTIYTQMILWMTGKITAGIGVVGLLGTGVFFAVSKHKKTYIKFLPLIIISVVTYGFLIYGYKHGFIPEVHLPPQLIPVDDRKSFTIYSDSNIRYGIILTPCLILFAALLAARKKMFFYGIAILFLIQLYANAVKPQEFQYSLPRLWPYSTLTDVPWFKEHYDGGLVLVSSNAHEDFIFQTGLPYKDFIYEGTRDVWVDSLDDPSKYARWIIYDDAIQGDTVNYFLTKRGHEILTNRFDMVYSRAGFKVFRLKQ